MYWKQEAAKLGIQIETWDLVPLGQADILLFVELPTSPDVVRDAKLCAPRAMTIAMLIESPLEKAHWFHSRNHELFDAIVSYCPALIDEKKAWPFLLPIGEHREMAGDAVPFSARKKLIVVNGNKYLGWKAHPPWTIHAYPVLQMKLKGWRAASFRRWGIRVEELYSRRRLVVRTAERLMPGSVEVYGLDWKDLPELWWNPGRWRRGFDCGRGPIRQKLDVPRGFCFSLCFENCRNNVGYISEKLIDAIYCGFVPVYLGAENVGDFFPADVFVDARRFKSDRQLIEYIRDCGEQEWQAMRDAGAAFIARRGHAPFLPDAFAQSMNRVMLHLCNQSG